MTETQAKYETKRYCGNCGLRVDGICTLTGAEQIECLSGDERTHWTPWKHTESTNSGTGHARTCRCDACVEYWERQDALQEAGREEDQNIDGDTIRKNNHPVPDLRGDVKEWAKVDLETEYCQNSLVTKKKERIQQLVDAHWSYMDKVLTLGQNTRQTYTFDQVMAMRRWDYTSAATHFYGHGYEDGQNESE